MIIMITTFPSLVCLPLPGSFSQIAHMGNKLMVLTKFPKESKLDERTIKVYIETSET